MGTKLAPELAPNMGLHFKIRGGWPTDSQDPLIDFSRPEVSSQLAQRLTTGRQRLMSSSSRRPKLHLVVTEQ
jgi:hypothetical protein